MGPHQMQVRARVGSDKVSNLVTTRELRSHAMGRSQAVSQPYCASVRGTTERRNWRKRSEPAKTGASRISARVRSRFSFLPGLMRTRGFFGSAASTETTLAVPMTASVKVLFQRYVWNARFRTGEGETLIESS